MAARFSPPEQIERPRPRSDLETKGDHARSPPSHLPTGREVKGEFPRGAAAAAAAAAASIPRPTPKGDGRESIPWTAAEAIAAIAKARHAGKDERSPWGAAAALSSDVREFKRTIPHAAPYVAAAAGAFMSSPTAGRGAKDGPSPPSRMFAPPMRPTAPPKLAPSEIKWLNGERMLTSLRTPTTPNLVDYCCQFLDPCDLLQCRLLRIAERKAAGHLVLFAGTPRPLPLSAQYIPPFGKDRGFPLPSHCMPVTLDSPTIAAAAIKAQWLKVRPWEFKVITVVVDAAKSRTDTLTRLWTLLQLICPILRRVTHFIIVNQDSSSVFRITPNPSLKTNLARARSTLHIIHAIFRRATSVSNESAGAYCIAMDAAFPNRPDTPLMAVIIELQEEMAWQWFSDHMELIDGSSCLRVRLLVSLAKNMDFFSSDLKMQCVPLLSFFYSGNLPAVYLLNDRLNFSFCKRMILLNASIPLGMEGVEYVALPEEAPELEVFILNGLKASELSLEDRSTYPNLRQFTLPLSGETDLSVPFTNVRKVKFPTIFKGTCLDLSNIQGPLDLTISSSIDGELYLTTPPSPEERLQKKLATEEREKAIRQAMERAMDHRRGRYGYGGDYDDMERHFGGSSHRRHFGDPGRSMDRMTMMMMQDSRRRRRSDDDDEDVIVLSKDGGGRQYEGEDAEDEEEMERRATLLSMGMAVTPRRSGPPPSALVSPSAASGASSSSGRTPPAPPSSPRSSGSVPSSPAASSSSSSSSFSSPPARFSSPPAAPPPSPAGPPSSPAAGLPSRPAAPPPSPAAGTPSSRVPSSPAAAGAGAAKLPSKTIPPSTIRPLKRLEMSASALTSPAILKSLPTVKRLRYLFEDLRGDRHELTLLYDKLNGNTTGEPFPLASSQLQQLQLDYTNWKKPSCEILLGYFSNLRHLALSHLEVTLNGLDFPVLEKMEGLCGSAFTLEGDFSKLRAIFLAHSKMDWKESFEGLMVEEISLISLPEDEKKMKTKKMFGKATFPKLRVMTLIHKTLSEEGGFKEVYGSRYPMLQADMTDEVDPVTVHLDYRTPESVRTEMQASVPHWVFLSAPVPESIHPQRV